jgi:hypothetical protein
VGYELRIVRGRPLSEDEWRACVAADRELELIGWFDSSDGAVVVKNPDEAVLAKLLAVAGHLGARVVGDDGEVYAAPGVPPRPPAVSLGARLVAWLERLRPKPPIAPVVLPFGAADRVRDLWGREGTVVSIDLTAEHGLGRVRVRFDDGVERTVAAAAHGLTPVPPKAAR